MIYYSRQYIWATIATQKSKLIVSVKGLIRIDKMRKMYNNEHI